MAELRHKNMLLIVVNCHELKIYQKKSSNTSDNLEHQVFVTVKRQIMKRTEDK